MARQLQWLSAESIHCTCVMLCRLLIGKKNPTFFFFGKVNLAFKLSDVRQFFSTVNFLTFFFFSFTRKRFSWMEGFCLHCFVKYLQWPTNTWASRRLTPSCIWQNGSCVHFHGRFPGVLFCVCGTCSSVKVIFIIFFRRYIYWFYRQTHVQKNNFCCPTQCTEGPCTQTSKQWTI